MGIAQTTYPFPDATMWGGEVSSARARGWSDSTNEDNTNLVYSLISPDIVLDTSLNFGFLKRPEHDAEAGFSKV